MDEIDSQILCALVVDSRASVTELSELVGKSHSATRQRLHKLSTDGTIEKFTIEVNPEVLGLAVDAVVDIKSPGHWPIGEFDAALLNRPEVVDVIYLTGDFDYQIRVNCKSAEELNSILHTLRTELEFEEINVRVALGTAPGFPRYIQPDFELGAIALPVVVDEVEEEIVDEVEEEIVDEVEEEVVDEVEEEIVDEVEEEIVDEVEEEIVDEVEEEVEEKPVVVTKVQRRFDIQRAQF